jgi:hypothetical protein
MRFDDLLEEVRKFPVQQIWRYAVAGDLPGLGEKISPFMVSRLIAANKGRRGFTYTHKNPHIENHARIIVNANRKGFTINLSSNNVEQADEYLRLGIAPVVTLIPDDFGQTEVTVSKPQGNKSVDKTVRVWKNTRTPGGALVVQCPAEYNDSVQCANCGGAQGPLCQRADRTFVVGFTTHGASKRMASGIARRGLTILN